MKNGSLNVAELGLVGCGGAGFPTHIKLGAHNVQHFIVNGAECEPLLHKDKEILKHHTEDFFKGLELAMSLTAAKMGHIGVKKKYTELFSHLEKSLPNQRIKIFPLGDFYPSGDEFELVYEITNQLIPFGGIPLNIGCVVSNVETIMHLGRGMPFISKFLTIAGAVSKPISVEVPIGIKVSEVLTFAGITDFSNIEIIDGGPMMGRIVNSNSLITKTCGGLVVLPKDHPLVKRMAASESKNSRRGRGACDQCTDCTELCPRRLLGYPVQPHRAMRTNMFSRGGSEDYSPDAIFCCECGICSLFACPESLPPREISIIAKKFHLGHGAKLADWPGSPQVHPMRSSRRVGVQSLIKRLGLSEYDRKAPLTEIDLKPSLVRLPLKMNLGAPAKPLVNIGDTVRAGQKIGEIPERSLGSALHASINGRVTGVDEAITIEA